MIRNATPKQAFHVLAHTMSKGKPRLLANGVPVIATDRAMIELRAGKRLEKAHDALECDRRVHEQDPRQTA
jgi:hypothetical protein